VPSRYTIQRVVRADVGAGKVYDPKGMIPDPQVRTRDMVMEMHHPKCETVARFAQPIKLSATPGGPRSSAPATRVHADEVLGDLGLGDGEIAALRNKVVA